MAKEADPLIPIRVDWGDHFYPDVIAHQVSAARREHPDYEAAKSGDTKAAKRLAVDMLSLEAVETLQEIIGDQEVRVLPVIALEAKGVNKIPYAFAETVADTLGLVLDDQIRQANAPKRTGKDANYRMQHQPVFSGKVEPDGLYLLIDDHSSMGATIANLKGYIESQGAKVLAAATISAKIARLVPDEKTYVKIRTVSGRQFSDQYVNDFIKGETGYELKYQTLTKPELGHIAKRITLERELEQARRRDQKNQNRNRSLPSNTRDAHQNGENRTDQDALTSKKVSKWLKAGQHIPDDKKHLVQVQLLQRYLDCETRLQEAHATLLNKAKSLSDYRARIKADPATHTLRHRVEYAAAELSIHPHGIKVATNVGVEKQMAKRTDKFLKRHQELADIDHQLSDDQALLDRLYKQGYFQKDNAKLNRKL